MAERTRTCPQCGGAMLVRLGEFQCQQCAHTMPLNAPDEKESGSAFSGPNYGTRSGSEARPGTYSSIGSSLGAGAPASTSKLPPAQPTPAQHDPGAQYRNAPPPPPGSS